jgi:hypothetical protein
MTDDEIEAWTDMNLFLSGYQTAMTGRPCEDTLQEMFCNATDPSYAEGLKLGAEARDT